MTTTATLAIITARRRSASNQLDRRALAVFSRTAQPPAQQAPPPRRADPATGSTSIAIMTASAAKGSGPAVP
jgi:hypothetical protein